MHLELIRHGSIPGVGTFGRMTAGTLHTYSTVEKEWADNQPFVSCVPAGTYVLEPHDSDKYGPVWALVNLDLGVAHELTDGIRRYACLIHTANWPREVVGCIGVGRPGHREINGELGVVQSRNCIHELRALLPNERHTLTIRWGVDPQNA